MRRKVVDATKAWRMRRTRGDIGRRLLFAAAARAAAVPVFLAGDLLPAVLAGFAAVVEGFVCADLGDEDFVGADGFWPLDAVAPEFLSGGSDVAGELCWRSELVAEGVELAAEGRGRGARIPRREDRTHRNRKLAGPEVRTGSRRELEIGGGD